MSEWTRNEFEASIHLFIGGDLDADDNGRMEAWLAEHPEDRPLVDSAHAARNVLTGHRARFDASAMTPDLWPGIQVALRELGDAGQLAGQPAGAASGDILPSRAAGQLRLAASAQKTMQGASGGSGAWRQSSMWATAAAAVLLGGTSLWMFGAETPTSGTPTNGPATAVGAPSVAGVPSTPSPVVAEVAPNSNPASNPGSSEAAGGPAVTPDVRPRSTMNRASRFNSLAGANGSRLGRPIISMDEHIARAYAPTDERDRPSMATSNPARFVGAETMGKGTPLRATGGFAEELIFDAEQVPAYMLTFPDVDFVRHPSLEAAPR